MKLFWIDAPKPISAAIYIVAGCIGTVAIGTLAGTVGLVAVGIIALGGGLYVAGGTIYALGRPDPFPATFGYHEIFHVLVVVAAALHFAAIAGWVVPLGA
jgi:hemolysin III